MIENSDWVVVSMHAWTIGGLYSVDTSSSAGRRGRVEWHARFSDGRGCELLGVFGSLEEAQNACKRHANSH